MSLQEIEQIENYKKMIDADFRRFLDLERSWIKNISHRILHGKAGFELHW